MNAEPKDRRALLIAFVLALVTLALYWNVLGHQFLNYDDGDYLTQNPVVQRGLTGEGVSWAFTAPVSSNWHPLTMLSLMLDVQLFGVRPGVIQFISVLYHVANALLLFLLVRRMTGALWASAFVAAFFAWHPLRVESVAWLAERKDVLSMFFLLLTLLAWTAYIRSPSRFRYGLSLVFFALGLMSKPMLVTLPFAMVLLDLWPFQRLRLGAVGEPATDKKSLLDSLREKIPFIALTLVSSYITFIVQRGGQSVATMERIPLVSRVANALVAYVGYLWKTIWPVNLSVYYPYPETIQTVSAVIAALLLLGISFLVWRNWRARPWLFTGWFWYVGTLVPVIGIVQVGSQAMADRYSYIPSIGLGFVMAFGARELLTLRPGLRRPIGLLATLVIVGWMLLTGRQVSFWKNDETLFRHALEATTRNHLASAVLGSVAAEAGRMDEAERMFEQSIQWRPDSFEARTAYGVALLKAGQLDKAIGHLERALQFNPMQFEAWNGLGAVLSRQKKPEEALEKFTAALNINPHYGEARLNRAMILQHLGRAPEALDDYFTALPLVGPNPAVLLNVGNLLLTQQRSAEALGLFQRALQLQPDNVDALNRVAWVLATHPDPGVRNGSEALSLAQKACALTQQQHAPSLNTYAAALAENGRFPEAVQTMQRTIELARASGQQGFVTIAEKLLALYQSGQPFREE